MTSSRSFLLPIRLPAAFALTGLLALACSEGRSDQGSSDPRQEIHDLITALTPPPATSIPVVKSEYFKNRKAALERLRGGTLAHGREALRVYREEPPTMPEIRGGLLDIAAHTAPEETEPLLVELVTRFGEDLNVRAKATELLGECRPDKAIAVLEPVLRERPDDRTYPPEDRLLESWLTAMKARRLDPTELLALVATDMKRPMDVRHFATRALGERDSPLARQALETLAVESTGNGYIRKLAVQSLSALLPDAEFCALAKRLQSNEAEPEFVIYLESHIEKRCR